MADFKRHMKTHTRPTEDNQYKGWRPRESPRECRSVQKNPPRRSAIRVFGSAEDRGMHAHLQSSRRLEATLGQRQCPMCRHSVRSESRGVDFLGQKKIRSVSTLLLMLFCRHNLTQRSPEFGYLTMYHIISSLHLYCYAYACFCRIFLHLLLY